MLTTFRLWYARLTDKERTEFRKKVTKKCGVDDSTFYRYLDKQPPKLTEEFIAKETGIAINDLYLPA